jgi:hypothetical protein
VERFKGAMKLVDASPGSLIGGPGADFRLLRAVDKARSVKDGGV